MDHETGFDTGTVMATVRYRKICVGIMSYGRAHIEGHIGYSIGKPKTNYIGKCEPVFQPVGKLFRIHWAGKANDIGAEIVYYLISDSASNIYHIFLEG